MLMQLLLSWCNYCRLRGLSSSLDPSRLPNIFTLIKRFALLDDGLREATLELGEDARLHIVLGHLL